MKSYIYVLHLCVILLAICKSNSVGIPNNSPFFSKVLVHGPDDVESGRSIKLVCNSTRPDKELRKYTFIEMEQNCRKDKGLNISRYVTYSSTALVLHYPVPKSFQGPKTFACVLKSKKDTVSRRPCHTVIIGSKPGKPKVSCVVHGFQYLRCNITPSGKKVKEATGLELPRHKFSQSYQVLYDSEKIICEHRDRISKGLDYERKCKYTEHGVLIYKFPSDVLERFAIRLLFGNIFGETEVKQTFNTCKIEQPIIRALKALDVTMTSARLKWTIHDTLVPTEGGYPYYNHDIDCSSQNRSFKKSTSVLTLQVNKLRPYTIYECSVRSRTRIQTSVLCFGRWSEPTTIEFKTMPAAPIVGPLAPPGTISRIGDLCKFVFFEIPKEKRNGIVNEYRGRLFPNDVKFLTNFLNPSFNCSNTPKYIEIEGRTVDGGWSPPRRVDFRPITQKVDIELWQEEGKDRYSVIPKYSNKLKIKTAFLAVCNCSHTCHDRNFKCVGMRRIDPKVSKSGILASPLVFDDQTLLINEEKVAIYLSFEKEGASGQVAYAMSDFASCAYDKNSTKKSKFPSVKGLFDENGMVTFPVRREDLACSDTIRLPVYKFFTRVSCNGKLVEKKETPIGSEKMLNVKVKVRSNEYCVVRMSVDGSPGQVQFRSKRTTGGTGWIVILIVTIVFIVMVFALAYVKRVAIRAKLRTLCEEHPEITDDMPDHKLMNHPDTVSYVNHEDGYSSVELADTAIVTGRGNCEESAFLEQGVNGGTEAYTDHTNLLTSDKSCLSSSDYVAQEV